MAVVSVVVLYACKNPSSLRELIGQLGDGDVATQKGVRRIGIEPVEPIGLYLYTVADIGLYLFQVKLASHFFYQ